MGVEAQQLFDLTSTPASPEVSLIVPAYNEANSTARADAFRGMLDSSLTMLSSEFGSRHELLVVDDGSTDDTAAIACEFGLRAIAHHDGKNHGKGAAVRLGMSLSSGEYRVFADADGAYGADTIAQLVYSLGSSADIAVATRSHAGHDSLLRRVGHSVLERVCDYYAPTDTTDTQAGAKAFSAEAARTIWPHVRSDRFAADREAMHLARRLGYRVAEVQADVTVVAGSHVRIVRDTIQILRDTRQISQRAKHAAPERVKSVALTK
jgi:dolichyl-phosphate beta-glucosyltransferase